MGGAILLPQQDWVEQSCCHSRIVKGNPVATAGLTRAILLPQQDWVEQSCCHSRIDKGNPVATAGLTAGRVSGEKKHSVSDTARTASLTDLRRWPGDGFFGVKPNSGSDALPIASRPQDFSGKNAKSENRPRCRAKSESRPWWKNPDLGAGLAGGFYAGQVARWGGFYAGQARPRGYARQAPSRTLTVPRALAFRAICAISHKASH